MNLYNIYDSESGLCLGKNKTAEQISELFGVKARTVRSSALGGHYLLGKYQIKLDEQEKEKWRPHTQDDYAVMDEWDEVTEKARIYFRHMRKRRKTNGN